MSFPLKSKQDLVLVLKNVHAYIPVTLKCTYLAS